MADKEGTIHLDRYTTDAKQLVAGAQQIADEKQHTEVTPLHLLMRLLERDRGVCEVFRRAGADPSEVSTLTEAALRKQPRASGGVAYVSPRLLDLLARAEREATRDKSETVGVEHLLHAIAQEIKGPAGEILSSFGILALASIAGATMGTVGASRASKRAVTPSAEAISESRNCSRSI